MSNEQYSVENEIDAELTWYNPPDKELVELVEKGIKETSELFKNHPEMFSTEGDCVAHLYRLIGNKEHYGRKLIDPHPETGSCAIRREWKKLESIKPIDIVIIDSEQFKIQDESNTKTSGGFGSAPGQIAIEVKGPQVKKEKINCDIKKVSKLMGNIDSNYHVVDKGYVVVFAGQKLVNYSWEDFERRAQQHDVKFYYEKTNLYLNE